MMHGQLIRQTADVAHTKAWLWLQKGYLKIETESLITATQDQALGTNLTKPKSLKAECGKRKVKVSCTTFQDIVNWYRKSEEADMITWGKLSTGTSVEPNDLNTQKGGMNTTQKVSVKMRIGKFLGILRGSL